MAKAVFGAGCFWGVEKKFSEVKGVTSTEVGYSQGKNSKTSYDRCGCYERESPPSS